jgi:hypothetical protein
VPMVAPGSKRMSAFSFLFKSLFYYLSTFLLVSLSFLFLFVSSFRLA